MASLILRLIKGSPLTNAEVDGNFTALNNELATKITASSADTLTNKVLDDISNEIGANHLHFKVKATENLVAGDVVKVTGYNSGENAYEVAKMTAATDVAIGLIDGTIAIGGFGAVVNTGLLEGFDTSAFTVGQILYPNGTGGLTATQPTSGAYQAIAFVLRSHAVNGAALVEASEPIAVRKSTNTGNTVVLRDASGNFAAGTITANLTGNASSSTYSSRVIQASSSIPNNWALLFNGNSSVAGGDVFYNTSLTYNPATNVLTVGTVTGALNGNASSATTSTYVGIGNTITSVAYQVPFAYATGTNGQLTVDGDGQFTYNPSTNTLTSSTFSGALSGNATTATTLQTARTLWGQSFDGSANVTGALSSVTTLSMSGQLTNTVAVDTAPFVITSTTRVANLNVATAGTADTLTTARTINGTSFNGSANITVEPYIEQDNTTAATRYLAFVDTSTAGYQRLNLSTGLLYNPSLNSLAAASFVGNASTATTLQTARTINGTSFNGSVDITVPLSTTTQSTSAAFAVPFTAAAEGNNAAYISGTPTTDFTYNPSTKLLSVAGKVSTPTVEANVINTINLGVSGTMTGALTGSLSGNATTATTLQTARTINGTSFNGSADITTANWGTARTISLTGAVTGSASINGSANASIAATVQSGKTYCDTTAGSAPYYGARAWVNFNGTGTVAIRADMNVSSITDNGTGDYTVNFTTAMPDLNYVMAGSASEAYGAGDGSQLVSYDMGASALTLKSATQCRVNTVNNNDDINADSAHVEILFIR